MLSFAGKAFGNDAYGEIWLDGKIYNVLPKTFRKFSVMHGKEAVYALEEFARKVLIDQEVVNDGFFSPREETMIKSVEDIKTIYLDYHGNLKDIYLDCGAEFTMACKKFDITQAELEAWKNENLGDAP